MKPKSIKYLMALAMLAPTSVFGQTTAKTTPVGYVSLGDTTSGQPACKANTDVFISIPLLKSSSYTGTVSGVSGAQITLNGTPGFTVDQYANATNPHYLVVETGAKAGLVGLVSANGTGTVDVMTQTGDSLTGIAANDKISIRKAWTVANLFEGSTIPVGASLLTLPASGPLNPSAEGVYDWDGTNWVDNVITGGPADNDVLFPGETLILRNATATAITSLVVSGDVSIAPQRIPMASNAAANDYAISYFGPVSETIATSGLSTVAAAGDSLLGFDNNAAGLNKSASVVLDYDGTDWIDNVITGAPDNNFPLGGGQGFLLRRNSAGSATSWTDTATFVPTL